MYVLNFKECIINIYDHQGNFINTFGGKGNGPGEFIMGAIFSFTSNKMIEVFDVINLRLIRFSEEGEYLSTTKTNKYYFHMNYTDSTQRYLYRDYQNVDGKMVVYDILAQEIGDTDPTILLKKRLKKPTDMGYLRNFGLIAKSNSNGDTFILDRNANDFALKQFNAEHIEIDWKPNFQNIGKGDLKSINNISVWDNFLALFTTTNSNEDIIRFYDLDKNYLGYLKGIHPDEICAIGNKLFIFTEKTESDGYLCETYKIGSE